MKLYYIWGSISKVYYACVKDMQVAKIMLKNAKRNYPQEKWELITEEKEGK